MLWCVGQAQIHVSQQHVFEKKKQADMALLISLEVVLGNSIVQ